MYGDVLVFFFIFLNTSYYFSQYILLFSYSFSQYLAPFDFVFLTDCKDQGYK